MDEMRQEAVVRLTSVGRLKPTLLGHSASHSERLFLPDIVEKVGISQSIADFMK